MECPHDQRSVFESLEWRGFSNSAQHSTPLERNGPSAAVGLYCSSFLPETSWMGSLVGVGCHALACIGKAESCLWPQGRHGGAFTAVDKRTVCGCVPSHGPHPWPKLAV